jgi:putative SOS response-associated peptidase YedK
MCGRVFVKTSLAQLMAAFPAAARGDAEGMGNEFPRWNGAPRQDYPIIVQEPDVRGPVFMRARWGFIARNNADPKGGSQPINARSEVVASNGLFKFAYRYRRALMPVDGFFEWKAIHGQKTKQPYAIAMKDGSPFALAAIWDRWRDPSLGGEERRTFAVITCPPNELMATLHDRMPVILKPEDYARWISSEEDPRDLLQPFPAELMTIWPVDGKVGKPDNNTPDILDPIEFVSRDLFG